MGLYSFSSSLCIHAQTKLVQVLLQNAWQKTLKKGPQKKIKPWPWAKTWPVARLRVPRQNIDTIILAGDSGHTLAFGPGYRFSPQTLGQDGNAVISAHRDTQFNFLKNISLGDTIYIQTADAIARTYQVKKTQIVDEEASIELDNQAPMITLITRYPIDDNSPEDSLRLLIFAVQQPALSV